MPRTDGSNKCKLENGTICPYDDIPQEYHNGKGAFLYK